MLLEVALSLGQQFQVILAAAFRRAQHLIGALHLLEAFGRGGASRGASIRMIFLGKRPVGGGNYFRVGSRVDAERGVMIRYRVHGGVNAPCL